MSIHSRSKQRLVFGVTGHGLGHLTRACELANAIQALDPDVELHFWTSVPAARIATDLAAPFTHRAVAYEPGTAQRNCFELDVDGTVDDYRTFLEHHDERVATERAELARLRADAVLCDVPAVLTKAAREHGVPAIVVSNFTWDWILEPILAGTRAEPALERLRDDYASATHHIRLPFGPDESPVASSEPGPLVSRRASLAPAEVRARLGLAIEGDRPVALVCPGGWDPEGWRTIRPDTPDFDLVLVGDLPVECRSGDVSLPHALPAPVRFPDLVAMADVVLAKPGYGIASECVAHRTPLVTIDRPAFRETPLLRRALAERGPCAELGLPAFFEGRWRDALEAALASETPWRASEARPDLGVARSVLDRLGWPSGT
jgi:L-arabinokinase